MVPTGTVTFLFTDLQGSTRAWEDHQAAMREAVARHDEILRGAIAGHDGYVFATGGDAFSAAFATAAAAANCAAEAQRALRAELWPAPVHLLSRMGIHTGTAHERDDNYFGPVVNRAARVMANGARRVGVALRSDGLADDGSGCGLRPRRSGRVPIA